MWLGVLKNFLVGQPNITPQESRGRKPQSIGGVFGILIIFFRGVMDAAAFSLRVFLRRNLGERTFSLWIVLFAFLWVWYFVSDGIQLKTLRPNYEFFEPIAEILNQYIFREGGESATERLMFFRSLDQVFWYLFALNYYIFQAFQYIDTFFHSLFIIRDYPKASVLAFYYSIVVVFLGVSNILINWKKSTISLEKSNSNHRGDSVFFGWLDLIKIKINGADLTLSKEFIWLFVEPVFISFLSIFLYSTGYDQNFALFLFLSSIALFLEELREFALKRGELLDIFDGEFKAQRIEQSLAKHNQAEGKKQLKTTGAVLAKRKG